MCPERDLYPHPHEPHDEAASNKTKTKNRLSQPRSFPTLRPTLRPKKQDMQIRHASTCRGCALQQCSNHIDRKSFCFLRNLPEKSPQYRHLTCQIDPHRVASYSDTASQKKGNFEIIRHDSTCRGCALQKCSNHIDKKSFDLCAEHAERISSIRHFTCQISPHRVASYLDSVSK